MFRVEVKFWQRSRVQRCPFEDVVGKRLMTVLRDVDVEGWTMLVVSSGVNLSFKCRFRREDTIFKVHQKAAILHLVGWSHRRLQHVPSSRSLSHLSARKGQALPVTSF